MYILLEEIEGIIGKFHGEARNKLITFYIEEGMKKFSSPNPFDRKKLLLLKSILNFLEDNKIKSYAERAFRYKIVNMRALVLDLVKIDYTSEKQYFASPERWMELIIEDINSTFDFNDKQERGFFKIYNKLLCEELVTLFCSVEKFNTAGNQLLLSLIVYRDSFEMFTDFDFGALYKKFVEHFNKEKALPKHDLEKIFSEYKKSKKKLTGGDK